MKVLGNKWENGYLDYSCGPDEVRIEVRAWKLDSFIDGLYFVRPRDWQMLINYVSEWGLCSAIQKVVSRLREDLRNKKYLAYGIGIVLQCPELTKLKKGDLVVFLAPCHPKCVERIVLPKKLVKLVEDPELLNVNDWYNAENIIFLDADDGDHLVNYKYLEGWSPFSGVTLEDKLAVEALRDAEAKLGVYLKGNFVRTLLPYSRTNLIEQTPVKSGGSYKKKGVLFGFGNYAKSVIIPSLDRNIKIVKVHEIDPTQIGRIALHNLGRFAWDTSPYPRQNEHYDVYFVAGFHHLHTPIANHALERGAYAVVEKPLATNFQQLDMICNAVQRNSNRLFVGFQRRYSPFNKMLLEDLGIFRGQKPINYYCLVFEEPLPPKHWYLWPNSRSRIVSNGCHWIDHFLFLNNYAPVVKRFVRKMSNGDLLITIELKNSAVFSMVLTDLGSRRVGVRDYVEIRQTGKTIRIFDGCKYLSENDRKVIRKVGIGRLDSHIMMYKTISKRILDGGSGDDENSLVSSQVVLELDEMLLHSNGC